MGQKAYAVELRVSFGLEMPMALVGNSKPTEKYDLSSKLQKVHMHTDEIRFASTLKDMERHNPELEVADTADVEHDLHTHSSDTCTGHRIASSRVVHHAWVSSQFILTHFWASFLFSVLSSRIFA